MCGHILNTTLVKRLAHGAGLTALHYAVRRGDSEIVKMLLDAGADPYIENDLGLDAFQICEKFGPFPRVQKIMFQHVKNLYMQRNEVN